MKNKQSVKVVNNDTKKPNDLKKSNNSTLKNTLIKNKLSILIMISLFIGLLSGFTIGRLSSKDHMNNNRDGSQLRDGQFRERGGPGMRDINQ